MADIKYSQNFIRNKAVVKYLVKQAGIEKSDYVIEIGPGRGAITDILSEYADRVTAVEYDEKLYERLGKGTSTKAELAERNARIYAEFLNGASVSALAKDYFLVEKSIQRIIRQEKNRKSGLSV